VEHWVWNKCSQFIHVYQLLLWLNTSWSSQKCCPAILWSSAKKWRCTNHQKAPANKPSLSGVGLSLNKIKYMYPHLTAFIMTEHWLMQQPKMLPCHIDVECQKWRCINYHNTPANKASLSDIGKSLDQIKNMFPCLLAEHWLKQHWLKQPKMLPSHIVVECQKMKMYQPPKGSCK